ncbi:hypothetical protein DQK33_11360 [Salmonella enterica subsp. enterica serovar Adamstua]|nr:hypothetical protein [Salmonella enterica subsp. enterica serovar Adamstua]
MNENIAEKFRADGVARPNWSAVFAVAFCVACLITVEFLPVSLLTPMAQDLGISEGVAGQSVTVTAFVAMFSSLFITQIIQATDRRYIVILFAVLLTASCLMVSFANSFTLLLLGRACLGLALGGFWAMSASLTMRLVPARTVPKALSVIFGAVSIALVIAAPLGSFLGGIIGWRNVFNAAAALSALTLIVWGSDKTVAAAIAIIWGLAFALVPVGWSTWITRSLADQAEKAGSIQVAVIQLANTCGAAVGGYALDNFGLLSPLALSGGLMLLTALVVAAKVRITPMS